MLIGKSVEASENLFGFPQIEPEPNTNSMLIFEEISRELEELLLRENKNTTLAAGIFEFLGEILNQVQEEFVKLLGEYTDSFLSRCQKYLPCL